MGHGFQFELGNTEYRSLTEYISISELKLFKYSPYKYKHEVLDGNKKDSSKAQALGTLFHMALLEPQEFTKVKSFPDLRSRVAIEAKSLGFVTCNTNDYEAVVAARHEVLKSRYVSDVLQAAKTELSALWLTKHGIKAKCRFDAINFDKKIILDVKTCRDLAEFKRQIKWYGYDLQAAFYKDCADSLLGDDFKFMFLVVEMTSPYLFKIFEVTPRKLKQASMKYEEILFSYAYAVENDHFPHPGDEIELIDIEDEFVGFTHEVTEIS